MNAQIHNGSFWDDIEWDDDKLAIKSGVGSSKSSEPVKPVTNEQGDPLTKAEAVAALKELNEAWLRIDKDVQDIEDPQEQAEAVQDLDYDYTVRQRELRDYLADMAKSERARLEEFGARPLGMPTDEGNIAMTKMVDKVSEQFEDELQALKERTAERIREGLDTLKDEGHDSDVTVRDCVYADIVDAEVIESWEPMEF